MQQTETDHRNGNLLINLLKDHFQLASLEWQYEKYLGRRRLIGWGVGSLLLCLALVFIHVAIVGGLLALGLGLGWIGLLFTVLYAAIGGGFLKYGGRRDPRLGPVFEGTRHELKRSIELIGKRFF